jgi:phosphocarrier protein FPr
MTEKMAGVNDAGGWETSGEIVIVSPNGFHARPAAILVKTAKKFASEIRIVKDGTGQNAKSLVAVMGFALQKGDSVSIEARGPDAKDAIAALSPIMAGNMEAAAAGAPQAAKPVAAAASEAPSASVPGKGTLSDADMCEPFKVKPVYKGITASPGIAAGVAHRLASRDISVSEKPSGSPEEEERALRCAIEEAKSQLRAIEERTKKSIDAGHAAIFGAHIELLDDPELLDYTLKLISAGHSAAYSWKSSYEECARRFAGLDNELFAARAVDIQDIGRRVVRILTGVSEEEEYHENCVLIAEDLTPSDTATLDKRILGFCTVKGGATSHISILARSLELPALVGVDESVLRVENGTPVALDADEGVLRVNPSPEESEAISRKRKERLEQRERELRETMKPAVTSDGSTVEVAANIGGLSDATHAASLGCDGVGLLRSEFLFLARASAPTEDELAETYSSIARAIGPDRPLVVRTMDIGGDKPIPYIKQEHEDNPFLGVRGLRLSLLHRNLFEIQIRAALRASKYCRLHIMFPMVSALEEFREAAAMVRGLARETGAEGVKVGLMVEVPAAAILARHFAKEADFMSLGTNDLTQYTMAADRGNPKLANIADGLNPAVLSMIKSTVDGARGNDCWVGVCGGIAGEPMATPVLIGIGVDELSVSVPAIPSIKARVRGLSMQKCKEIAARALEMETAAEVREYLRGV